MTAVDIQSSVPSAPPVCIHATSECAESYEFGDAQCTSCGLPHAGRRRVPIQRDEPDAWRVTPYPMSDGERNWTEYAVESHQGPICTGVLTETIAWEIAALPSLKGALNRVASQRADHDVLASLCQLAEEQLAELKHLRAALGRSSESRSSVEVKTSARGVDVAAKSYDGSDVAGEVGPSVDAYFEAIQQVQSRLNMGPAA